MARHDVTNSAAHKGRPNPGGELPRARPMFHIFLALQCVTNIVVHGFGTSVEIAPLGRFGEPLDEIFDKRLFLRAAFAFDDDSPRDADRVPHLDRLLEADDLGPKTARELINCLPFNVSLRGFHAIAGPVEGLDSPEGLSVATAAGCGSFDRLSMPAASRQ